MSTGQETDDTETIGHGFAADADPHVQEITPVVNEIASKIPPPPEHSPTQITATRKPETDDSEAHNKNLETDGHPHVQEETPIENETTPKHSSSSTNLTRITPTHELETGDNKAPKEEFPKKISPWKKIKNLCGRTSKRLQTKPSVASRAQDTRSPSQEEVLSNLIQADVDYIQKGAKKLGQYNNKLNSVLKEASTDFENLKKQGNEKDFLELRKATVKLRLQIPSKFTVDADEKDPYKNLEFSSKAKQKIPDNVLKMMPQLHNSDVFKSTMEFKDFEARYNKLDRRLKLCLLCFSVFPEKAIIKKRLMVQWWVAEGFVREDDASDHFMQLIKLGLIEPVNENRSLKIAHCQMHPFYRSALVTLAERAKFFNFDSNGLPTQNFSESFQACLVGEGLISYEDLQKGSLKVDDLEKIHLLMNMNEPTLEFKRDWFSKMTNVNLLHLGSWRVLPTDHIEVEDTVFLDGLENMKYVKFLSLQGVSNIISLPQSILQLTNLIILDLRACHNLETIPEGLGLLQNLTHLDMSKCYLLDRMPKSLSLLMSLRVLKGFVVGDEKGNENSCTLDDLKKLKNLIKLCIYTGLEKFPEEKHVKALGNLVDLRKLTITWGGKALRAEKDNSTAEKTRLKKQEPTLEGSDASESTARLPQNLEKLDLQCFPMSKTPNWLALKNWENSELKKLYIRGGKFSDLGQYQEIDDWNMVGPMKHKWKVKVLRLKYLSEIEMEWRELQELFPELVYLEQVSCPKLTLFPCDANGVWINKNKTAAIDLRH